MNKFFIGYTDTKMRKTFFCRLFTENVDSIPADYFAGNSFHSDFQSATPFGSPKDAKEYLKRHKARMISDSKTKLCVFKILVEKV
jgi:hypothetical protein